MKRWAGDDSNLALPAGGGCLALRECNRPRATQSVLNACHYFSALKIFADKGIRLTVCIFASDQRVALASGAQIVSTLGDGADYLVISNPARLRARFSSRVSCPNGC